MGDITYNNILTAIQKQKDELKNIKPREKIFICTLNFYYHYAIDYLGGALCYITDKDWYIRNGIIEE